MFDAPDHTSKIIENYLTEDCQNCSSRSKKKNGYLFKKEQK